MDNAGSARPTHAALGATSARASLGAGTPNSGGASFFVNLEHNDFLDWRAARRPRSTSAHGHAARSRPAQV